MSYKAVRVLQVKCITSNRSISVLPRRDIVVGNPTIILHVNKKSVMGWQIKPQQILTEIEKGVQFSKVLRCSVDADDTITLRMYETTKEDLILSVTFRNGRDVRSVSLDDVRIKLFTEMLKRSLKLKEEMDQT